MATCRIGRGRKKLNSEQAAFVFFTHAELHALARELMTLCVNYELTDCRRAISRSNRGSETYRKALA